MTTVQARDAALPVGLAPADGFTAAGRTVPAVAAALDIVVTAARAPAAAPTPAASSPAAYSVSDHSALIRASLRPLTARWTNLEDADGLVLAEDLDLTSDASLSAGTRLGPAEIGMLGQAGRARVLVVPRPQVAVLSIGNELVAPGDPLHPGQIWESNGLMLASAVQHAGAIARRHAVVADRPADVLAALARAARTADLLVTSGGISMGGSHDSVKSALAHLGTILFRTVAMRPGKPQGFGVFGPSQVPIVTLPGNPVSAFVSFSVFVVPAIRQLQGRGGEGQEHVLATLTAPLSSPARKRSFVTASYNPRAATVTPAASQTSHHLSALARANALIDVPEYVTGLEPGDTARVVLLP